MIAIDRTRGNEIIIYVYLLDPILWENCCDDVIGPGRYNRTVSTVSSYVSYIGNSFDCVGSGVQHSRLCKLLISLLLLYYETK